MHEGAGNVPGHPGLGPSEWRLSKLLRGRRGIEWAMATHQAGESVLVLDAAALTRTSSLGEIGPARLYRGGALSAVIRACRRRAPSPTKPHALRVRIQGRRNGGGDLTITWVRRTRYSGEWRDLVDVPGFGGRLEIAGPGA